MSLTHFLTKGERSTLHSVCATLFPSVPGRDPAEYWSAGADDLQVADAIEKMLATVGSTQDQSGFRRLLRTLENAPIMALAGAGGAWSREAPHNRDAAVRALLSSWFGPVREGAHVVRKLAGLCAMGGAASVKLHHAIGYTSRSTIPAPYPISTSLIDREKTLTADVVLVGSGAGGGTVAGLLAEAGLNVIVLEHGNPVARPGGPELAAYKDHYFRSGLAATTDHAVSLLAGDCVGGGTAINWASCLRLPDRVRAEWEAAGATGVAGPEFDEDLARVEKRLSVSTTTSCFYPESRDGRLIAGCEALGWKSQRMPRNAAGCDDCGGCGFGCAAGAKQDVTRTFLASACEHGAQIIAGCRVTHAIVENGVVHGVQALARTPGDAWVGLTVRAPRVVLAAGALSTPCLLIKSGMANRSAGRHLKLHPTTAVIGWYDEHVDPWTGPTQGAYCDQFALDDSGRGFLLETAPTHPALIAAAMPWTGGIEYRERLLKMRYAAPFIVLTRDTGEGSVDRVGNVHYRLAREDAETMKKGMLAAARAHFAAGAERVTFATSPCIEAGRSESTGLEARLRDSRMGPNWIGLWSAHQMGTCRIGRTPRDGVCDAHGAVFGCHGLWVSDSSVFPSASGVNPMETIMAMAHRTARAIISKG